MSDEFRFEWDPDKARSNYEKHGVAFDDALTAFMDSRALVSRDPDHSDEEQRFILLGMSWNLQVLIVCHCYRGPVSTVRIISARRANRLERAIYGTEAS